MNRKKNQQNKVAYKIIVYLILLMLPISRLGWATDVIPQTTIDELLKLDAQAALVAARKNIFGVTPGATLEQQSAHGATQSNQVLAIYGLGKTLTAEVVLDAEPHIFKSTRLQPVWGQPSKYTLERIAPPCVYLKKDEKTEILCLSKGR